MTYAEELLKEGEARGEARGREAGLAEGERKAKLETAERLLALGLGWDTIRAVTDVDESGLAALRRQVSVA